jgi:SOS-response transcriptional repressor LexA
VNVLEIEDVFLSELRRIIGDSKRGFQAALCRQLKMEPSSFSNMVNGRRKMSEDDRIAISKVLGIDYATMVQRCVGQQEAIMNPEDWKPPVRGEISANLPSIKATAGATITEPSNISPAPPPTKRIPIVSWVNAGDWSKAVDPFHPGYAEDWIDTAATSNINAFALVVHGDSMEPEFAEGDIITVDPGRAYCSGSFVVAKNGEEATFKQLILDGPNVFLKPLNERYPIKDMTGVEMRIVGVVVEKRKRY